MHILGFNFSCYIFLVIEFPFGFFYRVNFSSEILHLLKKFFIYFPSVPLFSFLITQRSLFFCCCTPPLFPWLWSHVFFILLCLIIFDWMLNITKNYRGSRCYLSAGRFSFSSSGKLSRLISLMQWRDCHLEAGLQLVWHHPTLVCPNS